MVVRGAPAIGVAAAYAVVLAARRRFAESPGTWRERIDPDLGRLAASRPTAVNLAWALDRMREAIGAVAADADPEPALLEAARAMHAEDVAANRRMGELGAALIESRCEVLTHCNAGALATAGYGTALGVVRAAHAAGRIAHVYAGETRPWLQGARLTAYELVEAGIPVTLIADSAASWAMRQGRVRWVIVGADRIAANGDVANKIGTYSLAVCARHHGVRFMVVAPTSTIDPRSASGDDIPIESRRSDELLSHAGRRVAPARRRGVEPGVRRHAGGAGRRAGDRARRRRGAGPGPDRRAHRPHEVLTARRIRRRRSGPFPGPRRGGGCAERTGAAASRGRISHLSGRASHRSRQISRTAGSDAHR